MRIVKYALYVLWTLLWILLSTVGGFCWMLLRLPVRLGVCSWYGHDWLWLGNGFFGMFAPSKPFKCIKCGHKTGHPEKYKEWTGSAKL